jgi:hypothetical protein
MVLKSEGMMGATNNGIGGVDSSHECHIAALIAIYVAGEEGITCWLARC